MPLQVNVIQPQLDSLKLAAGELQAINAENEVKKAKREAKAASELAIQAAMTGRNRRSVKIEEARRLRALETGSGASGGGGGDDGDVEGIADSDANKKDVVMTEEERALLLVRQSELGLEVRLLARRLVAV